MYRVLGRVCLCAALVGGISILSACSKGVEKSANPLSPTIAGPIAGVELTPPTPHSPLGNAKLSVATQPVTLVVQNSTTNGVRTVYYYFEVASDPNFTQILVSQDGVPQGDAGLTSYKLPAALAAERNYYWRAQARDGANSSDFSGGKLFEVYTPVVVHAPGLVEPVNSQQVTSRSPVLTWDNAPRTGPAQAIYYNVQLSTDQAFTAIVASWNQPEDLTRPRTSTPVPSTLDYDARYYWRVRAIEPSATGPWSSQSFMAPATPVVVKPPTPPAGGGPAPNDAIDLRNVTIVLGPNIANWAVGATITGTRQGNGELCIFHTQLGAWPTTPFFGDPATPLEGNQWVFANIGNRWYGGAADWYRPGQACKAVQAHEIAHDAFYQPSMEPLRSWVPRVGETFGLAATTPARAWPAMATLDVRTNVVLEIWK